MKALTLQRASTDITLVEVLGGLLTVLGGWKPRLPTWPLLLWVEGGDPFFSVVFGWSKGVIVSERIPLSLSCPFPGPLAREGRLLLAVCVCVCVCVCLSISAPIGISELLASSAARLGFRRQKENP